ncbi:hypothetical protein [Corallococcus macrosporus]|uniref:Uncharacterized protein n=2 Tax=Myxococcaceae TaxID=31 RepID=F8CID5_MYXFH|nr:hypothetical protein [Corallococcus macrosporus]AEI63794.1 hypothetical protein LILAB_09415 [Corallococcus macrosporus]AEI63804.1 hypothetical protein LILAB_09465 [Corallococcus macrosporus]ATB51446.1 hypothetical protein MYMAC_007109 [Corallococcus macrosporus DSM 14697]
MGSALKGITKAISNVASTVSKIAGGIANIGGKAMEFLQKPLSSLVSPIASFIGDKVGKLPFVGKFLGPIAENLVKQGASSFLGEGTLGSLGFMSKIAPKVQDITNIAQTVKGAADKVGAFVDNPLGQQNFQNIIAQNHARFVE